MNTLQKEVLKLTVQGKNYFEIAEELDIRHGLVYVITKQLLKLTGCKSKPFLVEWYIKKGNKPTYQLIEISLNQDVKVIKDNISLTEFVEFFKDYKQIEGKQLHLTNDNHRCRYGKI